MPVAGVAPCQCFSPGANQTTSPGRMSSTGPPSRWAHPQPHVTIRVWPSGWVCQAVRAPGSNVTLAHWTSAGSGAWNSGSMRTFPVNQSEGPFVEGCVPALLISMSIFLPWTRARTRLWGHSRSKTTVTAAFLSSFQGGFFLMKIHLASEASRHGNRGFAVPAWPGQTAPAQGGVGAHAP